MRTQLWAPWMETRVRREASSVEDQGPRRWCILYMCEVCVCMSRCGLVGRPDEEEILGDIQDGGECFYTNL